MLYVDGYTGSMHISRNAVVGANALQGFMLCNWYGHSKVESNVIDLLGASWGSNFEIAINCDGNPIIKATGNLVLSDKASPMNDPDSTFVGEYKTIYSNVCKASHQSQTNCSSFLLQLADIIKQLDGTTQSCN